MQYNFNKKGQAGIMLMNFVKKEIFFHGRVFLTEIKSHKVTYETMTSENLEHYLKTRCYRNSKTPREIKINLFDAP